MKHSFCNSADQILAFAQQNACFSHALEAAKAEDAFRRNRFADDLSLLSGWGHDFCCPACAAQFLYEHERPPKYVCPNCGQSASGQVLDEAWAYYTRYHTSVELRSSALCYCVYGDPASLDYIIRYVDFYAEHYAALPIHGEHAGAGKIMGQSLDEAVWALHVLTALNICGRKAFPEETLEQWMKHLFRPMTELLMPQAQYIHNIPLWLWCAIGAIAIFFADDALLNHALESEFGIRAQIRSGLTADGLWYEGSMGYHYYSSRALAMFLSFYGQLSPTDKLFDALRASYEIPVELSADGEHLPAINDGWYPLTVDKEFNGILRAQRIVDSPILSSVLNGIFERSPELFETADALLFLQALPVPHPLPERDTAKAYPATALAVLYRPQHVLMKCGVLTLSHMHDDCMSIILPPFSDDLGTPGYGHSMTDRYYRRSLAHNTFLMDGQSQPHRPVFGRVEAFDGGIRGQANEIYDGVSCMRTIVGNGNSVTDEMVIQAEEAHTFDWVFRASGHCTFPEGGEPATLAYDLLTDIRQFGNLSSFEVRYELNGQKLTVRIDHETLKAAEVYTASIPGNPADQRQTAILLRTHGTQIRFLAHYEQA